MYKYHQVALMIFILWMSLLLTGHEIFITSRKCHRKAFNNSNLLGLKGFQTFSQLHIGRLRKSPPACKQDRQKSWMWRIVSWDFPVFTWMWILIEYNIYIYEWIYQIDFYSIYTDTSCTATFSASIFSLCISHVRTWIADSQECCGRRIHGNKA